MLNAATIFTRISGVVSMLGLLLIAALTVLDVALRWAFGSPIEGQADITEVVLPVIVATAFVSSVWGRPQIGIRFVGTLIGVTGRRILDIISDLSIAAFFAVIAYQFWRYAGELADESRQTMDVGIPLYPFWYIVACVVSLTALIQTLNALVLWQSPRTYDSQAGEISEESDEARD